MFFELWPFIILGILPCQQNISKTVRARALKLGEWIFYLFVLRFYGPVNPMGHVERGQFD